MWAACDVLIVCPAGVPCKWGNVSLCVCVGLSGPSEGHQESFGSERQEGEKAQEEGEER